MLLLLLPSLADYAFPALNDMISTLVLFLLFYLKKYPPFPVASMVEVEVFHLLLGQLFIFQKSKANIRM